MSHKFCSETDAASENQMRPHTASADWWCFSGACRDFARVTLPFSDTRANEARSGRRCGACEGPLQVFTRRHSSAQIAFRVAARTCNSCYEFSLGLHQVPQQGRNTNQARDGGLLRRCAQSLIVYQPLAHLDYVQIAIFNFPQLSRFQFVPAFNCYGFHIRTDT